MTPSFLLQIVHTDSGQVVTLPAGGALERDLIEDCTNEILAERNGFQQTVVDACVAAIVAKGVGWFRSSTHVAEDIRAGLLETLQPPDDKLRAHVRDGIRYAILKQKLATIPVP